MMAVSDFWREEADRSTVTFLIRCAGVEGLGGRLSAADGRNLVITESNIIPEIGL
jgi:hypothetical protein